MTIARRISQRVERDMRPAWEAQEAGRVFFGKLAEAIEGAVAAERPATRNGLTSDDVRALILKACDKAGSRQAWATQIKVSPTFLGDVIHGRREPSPSILRPLGLEKVVLYRRVRQKS